MQSLRIALGDDNAPKCGRCSRCKANDFLSKLPLTGDAQTWLGNRDVPIAASRRPPMEAGLSTLNGQLRGQLFVQFMRQRADSAHDQLSAELQERIRICITKLREAHPIGAVIPIPSRTWQQRESTAHFVAGLLDSKAYPDLLAWRETLAARQGELLNNDQRRHNVKEKMFLTGLLMRPGAPPPKKGILLLDDYIGSGATLKEGVRALRKEGGFTGIIVPFTVAQVRWRIGARGMI